MDARFSVRADPENNRVRIVMGGFFQDADIAAFRTELERELALLRCGPNRHLTLCDVSAMKIQTQDMVAAFAQVVGDARYRSRRLAFVTGSSLSRLQTRRLTDRDGVEFFNDPAAAEDWLST